MRRIRGDKAREAARHVSNMIEQSAEQEARFPKRTRRELAYYVGVTARYALETKALLRLCELIRDMMLADAETYDSEEDSAEMN